MNKVYQEKPVAVCREICGWQQVYFFVRKVKKSETRIPWNSRRWFLIMGKFELINTGRLTEKQVRLNMEKCAEFLARMIQKYGDVVLRQKQPIRKSGHM